MSVIRKQIINVFGRTVNINSITASRQYIFESIFSRSYHYQPILYKQDRDPAPLFFRNEVQNLLKKLTRVNLDKVFRHRKLENRQLETPTYRFMTDDQLQNSFKEAAQRANEMLQMPPIIKVREPISCILSKDPALQGYDTAKYVFTDITYGISDRDRLIVIRDTEGNLMEADWDTRQRMSQIYFPQPGRHLRVPLMFSDNYLKSLLERKEYEFILDAACAQFEPDDPDYQKVTSTTYQHLSEQNDFEILRSTRHFGPLVFFLTWFDMIDNLLLELIGTASIDEANSLLKLYDKLHNKKLLTQDVTPESNDDVRLIRKYISENSNKKGQLELALQSYIELEQKSKSKCEHSI